jgi:cellulose synthase/poly-beta-1,6-N-acetylglucosamine synthase-like glycosyltransferase
MKLLFWLSLAIVVYAYFGYALLLWVISRLRNRPVIQKHLTPRVSIVIAVRNEEQTLPGKLDNLRRIDYPVERLQTIIVSDGSTDRTSAILEAHIPHILPVILAESNGKGYALNEAIKHATGEILVFMDARQSVEPDAIRELVSCFSDPDVGAASGELLLGEPSAISSNALGLYWNLEKAVRKLESASGSVVGVTGALYAIRRELYAEIPRGTILDDVLVPMRIARAGKRIVFQPSAIAHDRLFSRKGKEFSRKVRTLAGNYQLLRLAPWLLSPSNPLFFRFVSHKLLRLVAPLLLIVMLAASVLSSGLTYQIAAWSQVTLYALAALGTVVPSTRKFKPIAVPNTFVMLNAAAVVAFCSFIAGKKGLWTH